MTTRPTARRRLRDLCRIGAAASALMILSTAMSLVGSDPAAQAAGTLQGAVTFQDPVTASPVTSGGSEPFAVRPPQNAACPGGASETPSYRWQTFFVASGVDASALTYNNGPVAAGDAFVNPLYDSAQNPVTDRNPSASPKGLITNIPTMSFEAFAGATPAPGTYKVGIACTLEGATVSYWETMITIAADAADEPVGIAWAIQGAIASTTTTAASTTTAAPTTTVRSTTTTAAGATTTTSTTVAGMTTTTSTTVAGATTTSTTIAVASAAGAGTSSSGGSIFSAGPTGGSALPVTGPSATVRLLVWSLLLLVFGRMAVLLGRPIRVLPYGA